MNDERLGTWSALAFLAVTTIGCASGSSEPKNADAAEPEPEPWMAIAPKEDTASEPTADAESTADEASAEPVEPNFTPGMSVEEATNAVPSSTQRLNIEQERLAEPLMKPELYEPCSLQGHHHFTLRVAVWDGKAVGLDVDTKDPKLASCLRNQVQGVEWEDKAKSLNTVEYTY